MVDFDMIMMRASLMALVAVATASAATATPSTAQATPDIAQATEQAARKGTRNYRPGDAPLTTPGAGTQAQDTGPSRADKLSQCMDTWDKGTHITKSKWREICVRQLNER